MIILISGASHTGKTALSQKLMEKYNILIDKDYDVEVQL